MESIDRHKDKFKAELDELRAEVDKLKAQAAKTKAEQSMKFDRYLESIEEKQKEIGDRVESVKESSGDAWDDIKSGLKDAKQRLAIAKRAAEARFH